MIIEFTGVPCCGKSDISHGLARMLRAQGHTVCEEQYELSHCKNTKKRVVKKLLSCFRYCLKKPQKAIASYRVIASKRLWMNYIYLLSHRCNEDVCILEQGYLQFIGSFFDDIEVDDEKMEELFKKLVPETEILQVYVVASKEAVLTRATSREDKPFFMKKEKPEKELDKVFKTVEKLEKLWRLSKGEENIITVQNEKENSQMQVAEIILDEIMRKKIL